MLKIVKKFSTLINEFEPHSVVSVIQSSAKDVKSVVSTKSKNDKRENHKESNKSINHFGIQMINEKLRQKIFGNVQQATFDPEVIEKYG